MNLLKAERNIAAIRRNMVAESFEELAYPYPWTRCQAPLLDEVDFWAVSLAVTGQLFGQTRVPHA